MARKTKPSEPPPADVVGLHVRDEAIAIPPGDTTYTVDLDEDTVDDLAKGICSEALAQRMYSLLRWRRDAYRQLARRHADD